jgi:hypothetical protein
MISLLITHSVQLSLYSIPSQLHFAYKLAGAVDHVVTGVVRASLEYHHSKTELSLFGVQSDFILFHFTIIVAQVPQFGYIFSIFVFFVPLKQRTEKASRCHL